jgi:hypothetical protein
VATIEVGCSEITTKFPAVGGKGFSKGIIPEISSSPGEPVRALFCFDIHHIASIADLIDNFRGDSKVLLKRWLSLSIGERHRVGVRRSREKMTDENVLTTIDEFNHALTDLFTRCELHKPQVAAALVAAAVVLAASEGCDPDAQAASIASFAENAIDGLNTLTEPDEPRH